MKRVNYLSVAEDAITKIKRGAFLTAKSAEDVNSMTIGWASIGFVWKKPIMMVTVRRTRHTFSIIERADDFTVSIPSGDMGKEIAFCGTKSGREYNKYKECNLQLTKSQRAITPIIKVPGLHFECKIIYKSALNPAYLNEEDDKGIYPAKDYHTLYFGEIMDCYEMD